MISRLRRWRRAGLACAVLLVVLPAVVVLPWRWVDPPTSAFMLRARSDGFDVRQVWVDWAAIAPDLAIAVVAAEDQSFPDHRGFDLEAIRAAFEERHQRRRGASTISQQVAKNLFLWPGQSWLRKGLEAYLTLFVELLWSKRRILEIYLNIAEFGPGIFGVEAASREFFGTSAREVSARQAAALAAVLPNPKQMSAAEPSLQVKRRAAWILRQMEQLGGAAHLAGL